LAGIIRGTPEKDKKLNSNIKKQVSQTKSYNPKNENSLDLSFASIDSIFGSKNNTTDLQKKEQWQKYKGQKVTWTCKVVNVDESSLTPGYTLNLKCNPETLTTDVKVNFSNEWKSKLINLKKDDTITVTGVLDDYGIFGYTLNNGSIH